MMKTTLCSMLALSLVATAPKPAYADLKDALIGGVIGAAINQSVHNSKKKSTTKRKVYHSGPATLNSTYTRDEKRAIQTSLNAMGLNVGVVDGSLGPNSRRGIRHFQASRGEAQTGQLTRAQFVALTGIGASVPTTAAMLDRRLAPNEVASMQQGLQALGFYRGPIDGVDGPGTQNARIGFLINRGYNPQQLTQVQSAVLVSQTAGYPVAPYMMQEAQTQMAAMTNPNPFGQPTAPQTATAGFGVQPQPQQQFGTAPTTTATFGVQPQAQPQQQQLFGAQPTQPATNGGQQQQLFGAQPQVQPVPQGQNGQVFANAPATGAVPQQQAFTAPQQGQAAPAQQTTTLDIFSVQQPQQAPAGQQPVTTSTGTLFAPAPQTAATTTVVPTGN